MSTGQPRARGSSSRAEPGDLEGALVGAGLRAALTVPIRRGLERWARCCSRARPPARTAPTTCRSPRSSRPASRPRSRRSRLYQALADERSTLPAVLGSTADAVLVVNEEGVVHCSPTPPCARMLGLGSGRDDGPARCSRPSTTCRCASLLEERRAGVTRSWRCPTAAPRRRAGPGDHGLRRARRARRRPARHHAAQDLEQMKNDFVNTVSHDLKNPITVIAGTPT